jgi:hypothetical protein
MSHDNPLPASGLPPEGGSPALGRPGAGLITQPHLDAPDEFYEALIDAHRDLTTAQSHELNAKLVLLLANHIGTLPVLKEALAAARTSALAAAKRNS